MPMGPAPWDQAAQTLARYRIEYEIPEHGDPLVAPPADAEQCHDYQRAQRAREQLAQELGRQPPGHELDVDR